MVPVLSDWPFDPTDLTSYSLMLTRSVADAVISLGFFAVAAAFMRAERPRSDRLIRRIIWPCTLLVLLCGAGYWLDLLSLWVPAGGMAAVAKVLTAVVSIVAAIVLWRHLPKALALPAALAESETRRRASILEASRLRDQAESLLVQLKQAQGASEERFSRVVEAAPNAMVMINDAGKIEMVNAQTERLFGYARVEMLGQPIEMLVPARFRTHHPALRNAFLSEPSSRPMGAGRDLFGLRKDGSEFPVEIGLNPMETDEGAMVLSAIVDLSARKRLEERFQRMVEAAPNAMVMINAAGKIEMVNAQTERLFGHTRTDLLGQPIEILVPVRFRSHHPALRTAFFTDPKSRPMGAGRDLFGLRKDGSEFPVEIGLNPIDTEEGPMVLSAIVDIASRVQLEAQLRQAQKMEAVGRLTAGVAHDFNNLLQSMMGGLQLLQDRVGTDPTSNDLVQMSIDAAQRGARLTHHLLAFSRKQVLRPRPIEITSLLRKTVVMLERTLGPNILIHATEAELGLHAFADPAQLEACILNLAINARDAMPRGGTLRIHASGVQIDSSRASETLPPGDYAVLAVEDNGVGIEGDVLEKVFEPFFTTKNIGEGSGLGLSMVMGYARQSGGDVRISSVPGSGTRVEVFLPNVGAGKPQLHGSSGREAPRRDSGHVLLVDDSPDVLVTLAAFLEGNGFTVSKARDAQEALAIVGSNVGLDVVVTDYAMPGLSGGALLRRVGEIRPTLPALVVTGYLGIEELGELPAFIHVLHKPFLRSDLLEHVQRLVRQA